MKNNIEFPVTNEFGLVELKSVQNLLLANAVIVRNLLEEAGVNFCLAFGTLLGAARHEGFIPWDDDVDFYIADEDYEKAMDVLDGNLPEHLILHSRRNDHHYFHNWSRVKDLRTEVESTGFWHEHNDRLKFKCLGIDLYRLSQVSKTNVAEYIRNEAEIFWRKKLDSGLISKKEYTEGTSGIDEYVRNKFSNLNIPEPDAESFRFCIVQTDCLLSDSVFFPCSYLKFENELFPVPANTGLYLEETFGDYNKPPRFEDRLPKLKSFRIIDN